MASSPPINDNVAANQTTLPTLVSNVTSQFIVTPPTPTTIGVSGYIFNIIGNEEFSCDAEITDSYTETNITYQDQIALRPEQFTLYGYVGEVVNQFSNSGVSLLTVLAIFGIVPGMGANFNTQDEQFYDKMALVQNNVNNAINLATSIFGLFSTVSTTVTKQQKAFSYFYNLWLSRTLCQVETPWGVMENMAILNVRARQDETTRLVSDFSVTFKAMRFASTTIGTQTSPATTSPTQSALPVPSTIGSPQATAVLQSVPDVCSEAGVSVNNSSISTAILGLNLGS